MFGEIVTTMHSLYIVQWKILKKGQESSVWCTTARFVTTKTIKVKYFNLFNVVLSSIAKTAYNYLCVVSASSTTTRPMFNLDSIDYGRAIPSLEPISMDEVRN